MSKTITRSTVNENQYAAPEFPKSGFNLGYRDYNDYILGRWQVSGYQWCMPSDKISGHNKGNFTFNRIVTPMVAPVHVGQYNVYCTLRSIDNTFQDNVAPSKHNGYSADWRMPMTNTRYLVSQLLTSYGLAGWFSDSENGIGQMLANAAVNPDTTTLSAIGYDNEIYSSFYEYLYGNTDEHGLIETAIYNLTNPAPSGATYVSLYTQAVNMYAVDALKDIVDLITSRFGTSDNPISLSTTVSDFLYNFFDCLLTPFVGRYSYFCDFGFNFVRPSDLYRLSHGQKVTPLEGFTDLVNCFDDTPMNEYPIRAMYAFWYDRCRDVNLQPVSSTLPNPRRFGTTSIFDVSAGGNLIYLLYRIRRWSEDMFIGAQCDSPSRHVFAPIYNRTASVGVNNGSINNLYAQSTSYSDPNDSRKIFSETLSFLDPLTGSTQNIVCPVPSFVNDSIQALNGNFTGGVFGLGLQSLKQAQNLERYLKRLDYFGDEYNDYMLSQYNSRVSDLRINHPEILSQSYDDANYEQEIANMSNDVMDAGTRTATGTISSGGDGYTTFTEEFGIIINVISFMPDASYDNACPQLLMSRLVDLPLPIFAANNDELGRIMEISANGLSPAINGDDADFRFMFGHYPAYHAWRSRVDRVRGSFLNERQDCLFRRYYGMYDAATTPRLNYEFINCRPNLQMFANTVRYDGQLYGDVVHECYVERVLPTPVETI